MKHYVFLGPPASGKGTQGRRWAEKQGLAYLSTGALLRASIRDQAPAAESVRSFLEKGDYVPDEMMLPLVDDWVQSQSGGWVLDGFPRTLAQAKALDESLKGEELVAVHLDVAVDELRRRVAGRVECEKCHWSSRNREVDSPCPKCEGRMKIREDDSLERFEKRYAAYQEMTIPVVQYYLESVRVREIIGIGSPDDVFESLEAELAC